MYKIAYVSSSRADYGIVRNYLKLLNQDENIDLHILVTGMILQDKYGSGYKLIEEDGFNIAAKIDLELKNTSNDAIIDSMSVCLKRFGEL